MKKANLIFNLIVLIASAYFFSLTFSFPTRFGIEDSGPALFPRVSLGILIILLLLDTFIIVKKKNDEPLFTKEERTKIGRLGLFILTIFFFVFFLGKVNFILLAMISLFILCIILRLNLISSIVTSVCLSLFIHFVFIEGLNIIL